MASKVTMKKIVSILSAVLAVMILSIQSVSALNGFGWVCAKKGTVATKGLILTDEGYPIWVEYDEFGAVASEISHAKDDYEDAIVMSILTYNT